MPYELINHGEGISWERLIFMNDSDISSPERVIPVMNNVQFQEICKTIGNQSEHIWYRAKEKSKPARNVLIMDRTSKEGLEICAVANIVEKSKAVGAKEKRSIHAWNIIPRNISSSIMA